VANRVFGSDQGFVSPTDYRRLEKGDFSGYADFLIRVDGSSDLGPYHSDVSDTQPGAPPRALLCNSVCCSPELLEAVQNTLPKYLLVLPESKKKGLPNHWRNVGERSQYERCPI